jgi:glycosyltransferase involved in cell wall biosynthesis
MRVLHLTIDSHFVGGAEVYLRALVAAMVPFGVTSEVIDLAPAGGILGRNAECEFDFRYLRHILQVIESFRPHLLHTHLYWADLIGAMVLPVAAIPMVTSKYSICDRQVQTQPRHPVLSATDQLVYRSFRAVPDEKVLCQHATAVLVASHAVHRSYKELMGTSKMTVVYTSHLRRTDVQALYDMRTKRIRDWNERLKAVVVARLVEGKGLLDLVHAVGLCRKEGADVHCTIVGAGPLRHLLSKKAEHLGVSEALKFLGELPHQQALAEICQADVTVVPSHVEALSLVVQEAMGAGCPLIACRTGGIPEIVDSPKLGCLIPVASPSDLGTAMLKLLAVPRSKRWQVRAAHDAVLDRFTVEVSARQTVAAYERVLGLARREATDSS